MSLPEVCAKKRSEGALLLLDVVSLLVLEAGECSMLPLSRYIHTCT